MIMGYPPMPQGQPAYAPPPAPPQQAYAPQPAMPYAPPTTQAAAQQPMPQPPMQPTPTPPASTGSFSFADLIAAAEQAGFVTYPAGEYDVVVQSAEAGKTSNNKQRIRVWFTIVTGPYAGQNSRVRNDFVLSPDNPNALSFFFRHMEAMGLPKEYFAQNPSIVQVAQALAGRPCRLVLKADREYNGAIQNDVANVLPAAASYQYGAPQYGAVQPGFPAQFAPQPQQQFATASYSPQTALPQAPPPAPPAPAPEPQQYAAPPAPPVAPAPPAVPPAQPPAMPQPPAQYQPQAPMPFPPAPAQQPQAPVAPPPPVQFQQPAQQGPVAPPLPPSF